MDKSLQHPNNKDPDIHHYIKRPIYKDIYTGKDNTLKISGSEDINDKDSPHNIYDYKSLRNILCIEMDKPITIKQAKVIGDGLIDLYKALYFEDL